MAWRAASLISSGAAKSGKPWERLTALCLRARRVISRMTDSVNCSALAESMRRAMWVMFVSGVDMGIDCSVGESERKSTVDSLPPTAKREEQSCRQIARPTLRKRREGWGTLKVIWLASHRKRPARRQTSQRVGDAEVAATVVLVGSG